MANDLKVRNTAFAKRAKTCPKKDSKKTQREKSNHHSFVASIRRFCNNSPVVCSLLQGDIYQAQIWADEKGL